LGSLGRSATARGFAGRYSRPLTRRVLTVVVHESARRGSEPWTVASKRTGSTAP